MPHRDLRTCLAALLLAASACRTDGATRIPAEGLTFGAAPAAIGDVTHVDQKATMDVKFTREEGSQTIGPITIQVVVSSTHRFDVRAIVDGLPTAVRASYERAREYWGGTEGNDDDPIGVEGNSYLATRNGSSLSTSEVDGGRINNTRETSQLARDFDWLGKPGTLRAQMRGQAVKDGATLKLTPGEIMIHFPGATADMLTLTLTGLQKRCGRQVAVFDAAVQVNVWFRKVGGQAALRGTAKFDVATGSPLALDLAGPVTMVDGANRSGQGATVFGGGEATFKLKHEPFGACEH